MNVDLARVLLVDQANQKLIHYDEDGHKKEY